MDIILIAVEDIGDDYLKVTAEVGDETVTALGWVSATKNHYDAAAYGADGHIIEGSTPREMTPAEVGDYARELISAELPVAVAEPTPLAFA